MTTVSRHKRPAADPAADRHRRGQSRWLEDRHGRVAPQSARDPDSSELVALHGCPSALPVDYGPEFTAQPFVDWCPENRGTVYDIQPRKPDQNASTERFNRSDRTEGLNAKLVESLAELRALTDAWIRIYLGLNAKLVESLADRRAAHDSLGRVPSLTFLPRPSSGRPVSFRTVRLTGKLTLERDDLRQEHDPILHTLPHRVQL